MGYHISNFPTSSANQSIFQTPSEFLAEPYFFPVQLPSEGPSTAAFTQGLCFPDVPDVTDHTAGNCCSSLLLSELMLMNHEPSKKANQDYHEKMKLQQQLNYSVTAPSSTNAINVVPPTLFVPSPMNRIQGVGESGGSGPTKSMVFIINDVRFEVEVGELIFNVKEAFGDDAVIWSACFDQ